MTLVEATDLSSFEMAELPRSDKEQDTQLLIVSYSEEGRQLTELLDDRTVDTTYTEVVSDAQLAINEAAPTWVVLYLDQEALGALNVIQSAAERGSQVIVVGPGSPEKVARQCLNHGATQYLASPVCRGRFAAALGVSPAPLNHTAPEPDPRKESSADFPGVRSSDSCRMQQVAREIERVAPTSATVFIQGESGTGKEIVAQTIHRLSDRHDKPFIPVNCGAISPQLIESELFGHEKGSFTGALKEHHGVFERADGGTLFLDEITEMPIDLQVRLLRVLETHRFSRVGSDREINTDIRVIAATNRCPETEVEDGRFRADLLYRLQVFPISLPPLRERPEDIRSLAEEFLAELNDQAGVNKTLSEEAVSLLRTYPWPGNLRELKNVVQRAFIMADAVIRSTDIPADIANPSRQRHLTAGPCLKVSVGSSIADVEKELIFATLEECKGKKERAANILGVSMKTLYNRLREYQDAS